MNPLDNEIKEVGDVLTLSDEEFLNLDPSRYDTMVKNSGSDTKVDNQADSEDDEDDQDQDLEEDNDEEDDDGREAGREQVHAPDESGDDGSAGDLGLDGQSESGAEELQAERDDDKSEQGVSSKSTPDSKVKKTLDSGVDYKGFYEKVMAPFKANGRMIEVKSPDEAITLMQKGANYVRTMQRLKPYRKVLTMLEKHELLDEEKIGYLIDLDKKDEGAIRKLVKDSGLDPMDIGDDDKPYQPGHYQVTDEETAFRDTLDQLTDTDGGSDTIAAINRTWDAESKRILWKHPEVMSIIHVHRQNGVYDNIANEVERLRTLGVIPETKSFLEAYQELGNQMYPASGTQPGTKANGAGNGQDPTRAKVVDKGIAPSRQKKIENDQDTGRRVRGTSSSRPSRGNKEEFVNPLEMSDEEFLKQMEGRL